MKDGPGPSATASAGESEGGGGYRGVIVTSSRAAEAWGKAVEDVASEVGKESEIASCEFLFLLNLHFILAL